MIYLLLPERKKLYLKDTKSFQKIKLTLLMSEPVQCDTADDIKNAHSGRDECNIGLKYF